MADLAIIPPQPNAARPLLRNLRALLALLFIGAGVAHFLKTSLYVGIIPPYLPFPRELVYLSGIAEVLGGVGLLLPPFRRAAGWGLALLLVAVFPSNILMAEDAIRRSGLSLLSLLLLLRLPFQFLLIAWVERVSRADLPTV